MVLSVRSKKCLLGEHIMHGPSCCPTHISSSNRTLEEHVETMRLSKYCANSLETNKKRAGRSQVQQENTSTCAQQSSGNNTTAIVEGSDEFFESNLTRE